MQTPGLNAVELSFSANSAHGHAEDGPRSDDIETYARILTETVASISSGLASMAEMLGSLQTVGSDSETHLIRFASVARDVVNQREAMESTIKLLMQGLYGIKMISRIIGDAYHRLRDEFEDFMRNAWEKIKKFAKWIRDKFSSLFSAITDWFSAFISMLRDALSWLTSVE